MNTRVLRPLAYGLGGLLGLAAVADVLLAWEQLSGKAVRTRWSGSR